MVILVLQVQADGEDEPTVLEISPRHVLSWEKTHPRRAASLLSGEAVRFEYLYEVAWVALGEPGDFSDFCAKTDVAHGTKKQGPDAAGADPTNVAPSTESSQS